MLEGYITPLLMSYIDKYVRNIKPSDLKLSFWGGDAVLRNLELRLDVLERELGIPLEIKSGCIRELTLHLPWNAIGSSPVEVTIKDLEFVVKLKSLRASSTSEVVIHVPEVANKSAESALPPSSSVASGVGENESAPAPGYLQGYLNRIVNNVSIQVQNMVVKVIEEESDLMLSLNIGSVDYHTTNDKWAKEFVYTDYFQDKYCLYKVITVKDMTVNLHPIEIKEKEQGGFLHEPFVSRCEFACRLKFEHRGKVVERTTIELVVDTLEISVDEKQFCLTLHLADWLLGMYYSTKKLKGRDENPFFSPRTDLSFEVSTSSMMHTAKSDSALTDASVNTSSGSGNGNENGNATETRTEGQNQDGSAGWGTWLLSFAGPTKGDADGTADGKEQEGVGETKEYTAKTKSTLILSANTVTVLLKMTQLVQVPVFTRSFTSPVMRVAFSRCLFRLDQCLVTKLFWVCVGIEAVKADVMGVCPCVKKFPSSWRRASVASATDTSDVCHVFSLGPEESFSDKKPQKFLIESDVDIPGASKVVERDVECGCIGRLSGETRTVDMFRTDMDAESLAAFSEPFKALWFTYDYYNVGPVCSVEECMEVLNVGRVKAVFSPDVVHRLELFVSAFQESLKVTPPVSADSVVLGDPSAKVTFQIRISPLSAALTTCSHYLPTMPTLLPRSQSLRSPTEKRDRSSLPTLPCLCATFAGLEADMVLPMYRGNALPDFPQEQDIRVCVRSPQAMTHSSVRDLDGCMGLLSQQVGEREERCGRLVKSPSAELTYHSVSHSNDGETESQRDTSHVKLDVMQGTAMLSKQHLWELLHIYRSWTVDESHFSDSHSEYITPLTPRRGPSHLTLALRGLTLSKANNCRFVSMSATLGALRGAIRRSAGGEGETESANFSPFLYGPFDSSQWNRIEMYQQCSDPATTGEMPFPGNFVELLVTIPQGNSKVNKNLPDPSGPLSKIVPSSNTRGDQVFPTAQFTMSGCGVHLEPSILDFLRYLPPRKPLTPNDPPLPPSGPPTELPPLPYTLTPTVSSVEEPTWESEPPETGENWIIKMATNYAIRVKVDPILLISSTSKCSPTSCPGISSNLFDNFLILSQIRPHPSPSGPPSSTPPPLAPGLAGVVLSLPGVLLESAKSHVLEEPVPRLSRANTLPWDCTLSGLSAFTFSGAAHMDYVVEPVVIKTTLAAQREGVGVTIHSDLVAISLSKKQVCMLRDVVSTFSEQVSLLATAFSPTDISSKDSGIGYSRTPNEQGQATPSPTNATPTTLPLGSETSTVPSSVLYQGLSSLWLQLLVSKITLCLYGHDELPTHDKAHDEGCGSEGCAPVRISFEAESVSMQVDIQERCTDVIFKTTSMECDFSKLTPKSPPTGRGQWVPYMGNSNGRLFSTSSSNLSEEVLQATLPGQQSPALLFSPSCRGIPTSAPKFQPSFLYAKALFPHGGKGGKVAKGVKVEVSVCAFEGVIWLPVLNLVQSLLASVVAETALPQQHPAKVSPSHQLPATWPSVELSMEGFRVILPNKDFSHTLLINTEGAKVTSSVDFAGPEVRFVTNPVGYQRLALLSSEGKLPPLPAYQLGAYSVAVWGVARGEKGTKTFLYMSSADVQVMYTPPLHSTPQLPHPVGQDPLSTPVAGHSLEVNFSNSFTVFIGRDQLSSVRKVLDANLPSVSEYRSFEDHAPQDPTSLKPHHQDHTPATPPPVGTAVSFKMLITGKTVTACLLDPRKPDGGDSLSGAPQEDLLGTVSPLLVLGLYNPLCTFQWEGGVKRGDASLFSVAVGYNKDLAPVSCSDLADVQSWSPSLMHIFLTCTSATSPAQPPDLLSISGVWERSGCGLGNLTSAGGFKGVGGSGGESGVGGTSGVGETSGVRKVITVQVGRPCKLSCDPGVLLEGCLGAVTALLDGKGEASGKDVRASGEAILTNSPACGGEGAKEGGDAKSGLLESSQISDGSYTEVQFSTVQVTLELSVPTECSTSKLSTPVLTHAPVTHSGAHSDGQAPGELQRPLVLSWEGLDCSFNGREGRAVCSRIQLSSLGEAGRQYIALPTTVECVLTQHLPTSSLDMSELKVQLSVELLELCVSHLEALLVSRAVQVLLDAAVVCAGIFGNEKVGGEGGGRRNVGSSLPSAQQFKDDLRVLEFAYVVDESPGPPRLPGVGEILFHNGSPQILPTMTWHYWEPRTLRRLRVLPVPFNIVSEEDAPAISSTIKVVCTIEYWDEAVASFAVLGNFSLSESEEAGLSLESLALQPVSRLWRVCLAGVEWFSDESGQLETLDQYLGSNGQPCSLSAILSPLSLAASMQVDSQFSPSHLSSLTFSFQCKSLQATLLHAPNHAEVKGAMFEGYHVVSFGGMVTQELFKLSAGVVKTGFRKMHFADGLNLSVDAVCSLDFVDFRDLVWRHAVSPTKVSLSAGTTSSSSHAPPPRSHIHVDVESTILQLSQGLVHTSFTAYHLWKNTLVELSSMRGVVKEPLPPSAELVIPGHYVICNDTDEDLVIGQAYTDEELLLPSVSCLGYSWVSHTRLPQKLWLCLHDLHMQWTVPFSIDSVGVSCVSVPMGGCMAQAFVEVCSSGGVQKQVTIYGSWKFFSTLPVPLCVKLTSLLTDEDREGSISPLTPSTLSLPSPPPPPPASSSPSPLVSLPFQPVPAIEKALVCQPEGNSPSILGPRKELGGVVLRPEGEGPGMEWSNIYPLPCEEGWNKPHLLVELSGFSSGRGHFWFSVQPMDKADKPWGHKITFSPLFTVRNHLPLDLVNDHSPPTPTVTSVADPLLTPGRGQAAPPSTPELCYCTSNSSEPLVTPKVDVPEVITLLTPEPTLTLDCGSPLHPFLTPGNGQTTVLQSLCAEIWYDIRFRTSTGWAVSEPPVSLSTFLLQNLSVTSDDPYSPNSIVTHFSLPLDVDRGRYCKIQAVLLRDGCNTITVDLRAKFVIVNATPLTFDLVEPTLKASEGDEGGDTKFELGPSTAMILCHNEAVLKVEHKGSLFISNLLTLPCLSAKGKGRGKSNETASEDSLSDVLLALTPVSQSIEIGTKPEHVTVGKASVSFRSHLTSLTATVKPAFVFMNKSAFTVHIMTCITEKGTLVTPNKQPLRDHYEIAEGVEPGKCHALFFWNLLSSSITSKGITYSLLLSGCKQSATDTAQWSIHLSTNYVRHSFSLPVSQPFQSFAACLLTMHEDTGVTYLVLHQDTAPRVYIQNLTEAHFQLVELGMVGINGCLQSVPALHEVVYEPPSLAKLYPVVYDEDIASEQDKRMWTAAKNVKMKLRRAPPNSSDKGVRRENGGWSDPFFVSHGQDKELEVPGFGRLMVSTNSCAHGSGGVFISLLPALGATPYLTLTSRLGVLSSQGAVGLPEFKLSAARLVVLLCDDTHLLDHSAEVLRFVASGVKVSHSSCSQEESKACLTLRSLRVDNMMKESMEEFSVAFLPRSEHAAAPQLIKQAPLPLLKLKVEYNPQARFQIASVHISLQPATFQLEDDLLQKMKSVLVTFGLPKMGVSGAPSMLASDGLVHVSGISVPLAVLQESARDAYPVSISSLIVEPISIYVSANVNLKAYLSCKDTPFSFSRYELEDVFSNWPELSQIVAARYMSALFMHIGWVLGSLELIGSPVSFIQSVSRGLSDLVRLPYEGLTRSPGLFILGIGQGTASFVRQFSSGALGSVTNLASSIARNMEHLSMDPDHATYQDRQRRERPTRHFSEGITSGVSSFGLSLMSAVAGLVEQPVQSYLRKEESAGTTSTLLKGVGKGLLGVVTKPVGGAMDLVSKTGQGIMRGTGLTQELIHWQLPEDMEAHVKMVERASRLRSCGGQARHLSRRDPIVAVYEAALVCLDQPNQTSLLLLARHHLYIWDKFTDSLIIEFPVKSCFISVSPSPTSEHVQLCIKTRPERGEQDVCGGYEMIRQYLVQSIASQDLIASSLNEQPGISYDTCVDAMSESTTAAPLLPPLEDVESKGDGLVLCLGAQWAEQFRAVWESMHDPEHTRN